jgi:hypothetical protein
MFGTNRDLESNHVFQFDSVVLDLLSRSRWAEVILLAHDIAR